MWIVLDHSLNSFETQKKKKNLEVITMYYDCLGFSEV